MANHPTNPYLPLSIHRSDRRAPGDVVIQSVLPQPPTTTSRSKHPKIACEQMDRDTARERERDERKLPVVWLVWCQPTVPRQTSRQPHASWPGGQLVLKGGDPDQALPGADCFSWCPGRDFQPCSAGRSLAVCCLLTSVRLSVAGYLLCYLPHAMACVYLVVQTNTITTTWRQATMVLLFLPTETGRTFSDIADITDDG
ncbi:hypothetical protein BKA80DRAFT_27438 [Phyllosticta citrichinensis]